MIVVLLQANMAAKRNHTRLNIFKDTWELIQFFTGNGTISICDHGNQNRYFKPNYDFLPHPNQVVIVLERNQNISSALANRYLNLFYS